MVVERVVGDMVGERGRGLSRESMLFSWVTWWGDGEPREEQ
jgi:hypothetical protein